MQAVWDHEPPDQRFFRLYNKLVACPKPDPNCAPSFSVVPATSNQIAAYLPQGLMVDFQSCAPVFGGGVSAEQRELVEIADLDNPLGYKGNYIILPLKDTD